MSIFHVSIVFDREWLLKVLRMALFFVLNLLFILIRLHVVVTSFLTFFQIKQIVKIGQKVKMLLNVMLAVMKRHFAVP